MKTKILIKAVCIVALLCIVYACASGYRDDVPDKTIYVNNEKLSIFLGDQVQLIANPTGEAFTWVSENPEVVTVSQTGLVEAVGMGSTDVIVRLGKLSIRIYVSVQLRVPFEDIIIDKTSITATVGQSTKVKVFIVPDNATEVELTWASDNPSVASVNAAGTIYAIEAGTANITIKHNGNVLKTIPIKVLRAVSTITVLDVSDERASDGGGRYSMLDGATGTWWHSGYSPDVPLPHWAIFDLQTPMTLSKIVTTRRNNGDTKTLRYYVNNNPDPNDTGWQKIAEGSFLSTGAPHFLDFDIENPIEGRYLKLVVAESFRSVYTAIVAVEVYR